MPNSTLLLDYEGYSGGPLSFTRHPPGTKVMGAVSAHRPVDSATTRRDDDEFSKHPRARLATICRALSERQLVANGD